MKNKIAVIFLMLVSPTMVFADSYSDLDTSGLSAPGSGVTIVPSKKMNLPESMNAAENLRLSQEKAKGYSDLESSYPKYLIKMGKKGAVGINHNSDLYDTNMKYSPSQIKLAFEYKASLAIPASNVIGFAAGGTYLKNRGWTGIAEFFNAKDIGTCKYDLDNMKASNGAVQMSAETVRYDINKKPSDIFVQGSINSGFVYTVTWADNTYSHTLDCAKMDYDKTTIDRVIALAQVIDKG